MDADTIFGLAGMVFVILIAGIAVIFVVPLAKAKIKSENEEAYQKMASDAIQVQEKSGQQQEKLAEEMGEVKQRLASIEKILKEVE